MLVGRRPEQDRIGRLLTAARRGRSGVLLVRGEPGIGKTALLEAARSRARGMNVLSVRGVESERELPFAALADLLDPLLDRLATIPAPQARALRGAFALDANARGERFAVFSATLSLLAVGAEERPTLVLVDDAHWLDDASADALVFVTRRIEAEGLAVLLAARPDEAGPFDGHVPELVLEGLSVDSAHELLAASGHDLSAESVHRLVTATGGNPLALLEAADLDFTDVPGDAIMPPGGSAERAFGRRVALLPEPTQRALALAAAGERERAAILAGALQRLGLSLAALEPAESAGVVRFVEGAIAFTHPLTRAAAYNAVPPATRRDVHRALASELDDPSAAYRRAWHLAAAALGPDAEAAAALEAAGHAARSRGGLAEAGSAFERASGLVREPTQRRQLLREAAADYQAAGKLERSLQLLDEALPLAGDDATARADLQHLRGRALMWVGSPAETLELWLDEAARVEEVDPDRAAWMYAEAGVLATMTGDVRGIVEMCEHAVALARRSGGAAELAATAVLSNALILQGKARRALPMLEQCRVAFEAADPLATSIVLVQPIAHGGMWLEQYDDARRVLDRVIGAARAASAGGLLSFPLACLSELQFRTGDWAAAYANAAESVRFAEELGQANELCFSLVNLAAIDAAQGREAECREHVARARAGATALSTGSIFVYCGWVVGLLELGLGDIEAAVAELTQLAELVDRYALAEPGVVWWRADFVEALIRSGRVEEAERELGRLEREARTTGRGWAHAAAARCRGLLVSGDDIDAAFARAFRHHSSLAAPFERARTELCLGERQRRARRRQAAKETLRPALETFERLGAEPWAARTRAELRACGERRAGAARPSESLTAQELQVALLVAEGASNRDAAAALFVSPKTIEFHLSNVYRKLGIGSRTQLVRALLAGDPPRGR